MAHLQQNYVYSIINFWLSGGMPGGFPGGTGAMPGGFPGSMGGMPGGFPGGMGGAAGMGGTSGRGGAGMPDLSQLFSDPELLEAFKVIMCIYFTI